MTLIPAIESIAGRGKPVLIAETLENTYTSIGPSVFSARTVTEFAPTAAAISSSSTDDVVITPTAHGLNAGDRVRIAGHTGSTPDINGDWDVASVPSDTQFKIGIDITVGGTGGTFQELPNWRTIKAGMRVLATKSQGAAPARIVWGKILTVDADNWLMFVDAWHMGTTEVTPDGSGFYVNGRIMELPYCYELTETFEPDVLVHPLWRTPTLPNRIRTKFFGWRYTCVLDYSRHIQASTLITMRPALNMAETDNLVLIPRIDRPHRQYNVYHGEPVNLSRYGISAGHRKPVFVFKGKESLPGWPIPEGGYGYCYATNYGHQL